MKKQSILFLAIAMISVLQLSAQQNHAAGKGLQLSAGIGVIPAYVMDGAAAVVPPVSVVVGHRFGESFSLNGIVGYSESNSKPYLVTDGQSVFSNNRTLTVGLRSELSKNVRKNLAFYGGGMLGYNAVKLEEFDHASGQPFYRQPDAPSNIDPDAPAGTFFYSAFVGGKYFFRHNVGVFAEAGFGVSLLTTGFTVRL